MTVSEANAICANVARQLQSVDRDDIYTVTRFVCGPDVYWAIKTAEGPGPRFAFPQAVQLVVERHLGLEFYLLNAAGARVNVPAVRTGGAS